MKSADAEHPELGLYAAPNVDKQSALAGLRWIMLRPGFGDPPPGRNEMRNALGPYASLARRAGMPAFDAMNEVDAFLDELERTGTFEIGKAVRAEAMIALVEAYYRA